MENKNKSELTLSVEKLHKNIVDSQVIQKFHRVLVHFCLAWLWPLSLNCLMLLVKFDIDVAMLFYTFLEDLEARTSKEKEEVPRPFVTLP
jgi:hypothetical protein